MTATKKTEKYQPSDDQFIELSGKKYLPVNWRIVWFRHDHPKGRIATDFIAVGDYIIARAFVADADGNELATGSATIRQFKAQGGGHRDIEKAETAAIGRALACAGYGTQFADDIDESDHLADAPPQKKQPANGANNMHIAELVSVKAFENNRYVFETKSKHEVSCFGRKLFREAGYDKELESWEQATDKALLFKQSFVAEIEQTTSTEGKKLWVIKRVIAPDEVPIFS